MGNDGWSESAPNYLYVIGPNGQYIKIFFDPTIPGPNIEMQPADQAGWIYSPGHLAADRDAQKPFLQLQSPGVIDDPGAGSGFGKASLYLYGNSSFQANRQAQIDADVTIISGTTRLERLVGWDIQTVPSAAIGAAETVILSATDILGAAVEYRANRAYRIEVEGSVAVSVAANSFFMKMRKNNAAGQQLGAFRDEPAYAAAATGSPAWWTGGFIIGATSVFATIVCTLQGGGAWTAQQLAAATAVRSIRVYDDGAAATHAGWPTLV